MKRLNDDDIFELMLLVVISIFMVLIYWGVVKVAKINYRQEARGRECQVRLPGICTEESETVVLAHYTAPWLRGMGQKPDDIFGAYCCVACHNAVDGRVRTSYTRDELRLAHAEGVLRTQAILRKEGKL